MQLTAQGIVIGAHRVGADKIGKLFGFAFGQFLTGKYPLRKLPHIALKIGELQLAKFRVQIILIQPAVEMLVEHIQIEQ